MNIDNKSSSVSNIRNFITKREHKYFPITLWVLTDCWNIIYAHLLVLPLNLGLCVTELKNTYFFDQISV